MRSAATLSPRSTFVSKTHTRLTLASAITALAQPSLAQDAPPAAESRLHFDAAVEITTAYFFRGILQEDQGVIVQPAFTVGADLVKHDAFVLTLSAGTWNSVHGEATGAQTSDTSLEHWYESDVYFSLTASWEKWTLDATYTWYLSPNDAFETIQELSFGVSFDDSDFLGAWALQPSVTLALETGSNFADGADSDRGIYLGLGISPGFDASIGHDRTLSITFPIEVGLSLSDYYQDASGDDDFFGYASLGVRLETALPMPSGFGSWAVYGGVNALFLGDNLKAVNNDDSSEVIAFIGISLSF